MRALDSSSSANTISALGFLPGSLHNCVLEIGPPMASTPKAAPRPAFHLFSTHHIEPAPLHRGAAAAAANGGTGTSASRGTSLRQASRSKTLRQTASLTPSPNKTQRPRPMRLVQWTLRLCQQVLAPEAEPEPEVDEVVGPKNGLAAGATGGAAASTGSTSGSETEEEHGSTDGEGVSLGDKQAHGESSSLGVAAARQRPDQRHLAKGGKRASKSVAQSAWYRATFDEHSADELATSASATWTDFETRIKAAWDAGDVDIAVRSNARSGSGGDGIHSQMRVVFGATADKDDSGAGNAAPIHILLQRITDPADELNEATTASVQLMQALGVLKTRMQQLTAERDQRRKVRSSTGGGTCPFPFG